jgi:hypothetical protein
MDGASEDTKERCLYVLEILSHFVMMESPSNDLLVIIFGCFEHN